MPAIDFDDFEEERPRHLGAQSADGLHIKFYIKNVRDTKLSEKEGRPIHVPTEMVEIHILGDKTNIVNRPVEPYDKQRFAKQYKAFKEDKQDEVRGQPLKDWPALPENLAEDWAAIGIRSVEQLAEVPDHVINRLGPLGNKYKERAQKYLEASKQEAPVHFLQSKIEELEKRLAAAEGKAAPTVTPPANAVFVPPDTSQHLKPPPGAVGPIGEMPAPVVVRKKKIGVNEE